MRALSRPTSVHSRATTSQVRCYGAVEGAAVVSVQHQLSQVTCCMGRCGHCMPGYCTIKQMCKRTSLYSRPHCIIPLRCSTGDGCRRDEDGYYWITGRVDDVINVSGHRVGTAEVESALTAHDMCAEAAVIG